MNNDQFNALMTLTRAKPASKTREAARLHLVEGKTAPEVARLMAASWERSSQEIYPIVFAAIRNAVKAKKLAEKACGIII